MFRRSFFSACLDCDLRDDDSGEKGQISQDVSIQGLSDHG